MKLTQPMQKIIAYPQCSENQQCARYGSDVKRVQVFEISDNVTQLTLHQQATIVG